MAHVAVNFQHRHVGLLVERFDNGVKREISEWSEPHGIVGQQSEEYAVSATVEISFASITYKFDK